MGGHLNIAGHRSDDPATPSQDVGTVKLFENEQIRVWDMCVEPGASTGFHRHKHDYVFCQIGTGKCTTQVVDAATGAVTDNPTVATVPSRSVTFISASTDEPAIHRLCNASQTTNYRQILVEFLEASPRLSEAEVLARQSSARYTTTVGSALLFENARCRVWDFSLGPHSGQELPWHHHTLDYFFVNTVGGPNSPGKGQHRLTADGTAPHNSRSKGQSGGGDGDEGGRVRLWSEDRDMVWKHVGGGGFDEHTGEPAHVDHVYNHTDGEYSSFIVELK